MLKKASLYILLGSLLMGTLWRGGYFPEQKWPFAFALLTVGAVEIAATVAYGRASILRSIGFWLLAVFSVYAITTRIWSVTPGATDREATMLIGYLSAFFVVRTQIARYGERALDTVAAWLVYTATFVAAWGLFTFLWRWGPYAAMLDNVFRAGSSFEYSNALSCFSLMALPVTVAMQRRARREDRSLLAAAVSLQAAAVLISYARFGMVALAALSLYLVLSGWRGGFMFSTLFSLAASLPIAVAATMTSESKQPFAGLAIALAILGIAWLVDYYLDKPRFRRIFQAVALVSAGVGFMVAAALATRNERMRVILSTRFSDGFKLDRLLPHRLDTWEGAMDAFRVQPVKGHGYGSFSQVFTQYTIAVYTKYAHNLFLQMAVDTGLIGVSLLGLFIGYILVMSALRIITRSHPLVRAMAVACVIFVVYNMFDWEWYVPALTAWFMVGAACLEKIPDEKEQS